MAKSNKIGELSEAGLRTVVASSDTDVLFGSARAAIKFCVGYAGNPKRPASNRMLDGPSGGGRGLSGVDGAAQAGIISSRMKELGEVLQSVLIARCATRMSKCECKRPCCSGDYINPVWLQAVNFLSQIAYEKPCSCHASLFLRTMLVRKVFGEQHTFVELAEECELDRDAVSAHHARIHRWVNGQKATGIYASSEGIESIAWERIETSLRAARIVG